MPGDQKNQNRKKQKQCCNQFNKDFKNGPHQKKKKTLKKKHFLEGINACTQGYVKLSESENEVAQ